MGAKKFSGVKGMEDHFDPEQVANWRKIESTARRLFSRAGFQEIATPILEDAALFERSVGSSTEIVEKEMYTLLDRNGKKLAMRPEGTAPVVRAFIEHFTSHQVVEGRFLYLGPMFRYEKPQQGRLRQFHQIGAEVFGSDHPLLDAELIGLIHQLFQELGLTGLRLVLNSLGSRESREKYRTALAKFLDGIQDKLCDDCRRRMLRNPLRALDCKKEACIAATADAPLLGDYLSPESAADFAAVQAGLKAQGVPFTLQSRLVRGLDYYEKTVFEFTSEALGAQNAVAAGGRYNDLVHDLGGPAVPGIGFALGMERLAALLPKSEQSGAELKTPRVYLIGLGAAAERELFKHLKTLREAGATVEMDFGGGALKSKMRRADRRQADFTVIIGEDELSKRVAVLRDMKAESQEETPVEELVNRLLARFPTLNYFKL
ncbi:MAG TPA: histidine--tRNA ligase [Deltaproteobacteria bacterium]|nr:histidine--tRNA ligase [Deltaproteobacteria bacterium]